MRRFYFLALLALLASVMAHAATISQTPKPTSPLRATDKIPLGREGDPVAYAASVDQIMKYVYANYTGGGSRGPAGPQGPIGPQGPAGSPATNIITSVQGKTGVVVLTPSDIGAAPATTGASVLKGNGSGGTTTAVPGTDFATPEQGGKADTAVQPAQVRNRLTADRTYYVAPAGNDTNDCRSVGAPCTLQHAIDVASNLDLGSFNAILQMQDGTYDYSGLNRIAVTRTTAATSWQHTASQGIIQGYIIIQGNVANPRAVDINGTISASGGTSVIVKDLSLRQTASNAYHLLFAQTFSYLGFSNVVFGSLANSGPLAAHIRTEAGGFIGCLGNYAVDAGATSHIYANVGGMLWITGKTITLNNTPNFTGAFVTLKSNGNIFIDTNTYVGTAVGKKYDVASGGGLQGDATALPGTLPGVAASGAGVEGVNYAPASTIGTLTSLKWCTSDGYAINCDSEPPAGGIGGGADASGYYLVSRSANAPTNAVNLGALPTGLLKATVSGGIATISSDTTSYESAANKGTANGYAPLDFGSTVPAANIPVLAQSKITNLVTDLAAKEVTANKGAANGYAPLDASQLLPLTNIPASLVGKNAATASALAANGTNCTPPQVAAGVDAAGNAEGCFTPAGTYVLPITDSTSTTSSTTAASATAVKAAKDAADSKQSPATTLAGYGITDAYTKTQTDAAVATKEAPLAFSTGLTRSTNTITVNQTQTLSKITAPADSTTAVQVAKADGTTVVLNVDTTNFRLGVGTTSPQASLDQRMAGSGSLWLSNTNAPASNAGAGMFIQSLGGASGSGVVSGNRLGFMVFGGDLNGSGLSTGIGYGAAISSYAAGTWTPAASLCTSSGFAGTVAVAGCTGAGTGSNVANVPAELRFETTPNGSGSVTRVVRMKIQESGRILAGVALPTDNSRSAFQVKGDSAADTFSSTIQTTATDGATVTFDLSLGQHPSVTLGGNRTLAFTNPQVGASYRLTLKQDAIGNRTVTWPSFCTFITQAGTRTTTGPTLHTAASAEDTIIIIPTSSTTADCYARGY